MSGCFENRELSWLRFNERVLEEAEDVRVPLCERLSFLSIFQSNLDEFFMVRIGSLHDQKLIDAEAKENKTNRTPGEQIDVCLQRVSALVRRRDGIWQDLRTALEGQGIQLLSFAQCSSESRHALTQLFQKNIQPMLSPYLLTKKQALPFLNNKQLYVVARVKKGEKKKMAVLSLHMQGISRLLPVPNRAGCWMLLEELVLACLPQLFRGCKVESVSVIRVTRNADIDADAIYDEDLNYRDHMAEVIERRRKLAPVRLEMSHAVDAELLHQLLDAWHLDEDRVFVQDTPLELSFLGDIRDQLRNHKELFFAPRHPQLSPDLDEIQPLLQQVLAKDVLLHYPYQSIRPFLSLLAEASRNPQVTAISMTLYRLASDSKVVESLVEAAENGKQVLVLVELKARFDEENNIEWSRRLEKAGCHVIYGIEHLKVHSKLCLITLDTPEGKRHITQIGTGNYNEKTSRLYTDLSLMTADEAIASDAQAVFDALALGETVDHVQQLLVAPHCMQNRLLDMIDGEIAHQRLGGQGKIRLKMNSLTDRTLMEKLMEASCAGVQIDMIVRGICCLKPGVAGETENIRIISIVGRLLEHSRIYLFGEGDRLKAYLSSADWMTRNMLRRVEVAAPVLQPELQNRLTAMFDTMWQDNVQAREQQPDGTAVRRYPGEDKPLSSQNALYDEAYRLAAAVMP